MGGWACHSCVQEVPSGGLPCSQLCGLGLGQDATQTEIPFLEKLLFCESVCCLEHDVVKAEGGIR